MRLSSSLFACALSLLAACGRTEVVELRGDDPAPAPKTAAVTPKSVHGAAIGAGPEATLSALAKDPSAFVGKSVIVAGKVSAVCEHRGCWMELGEEGAAAHVKMAGHGFFVPRDCAGKRARVQARLVTDPSAATCEDATKDGKSGCTAEAEKALGRPLAKLQLEASGVEIF